MTPISRPRFSKQNTARTRGSLDSSAVRSAQASTTVRARAGLNDANEASCAAVKQTTSQRPAAARPGHMASPSTRSSGSSSRVLSEGKRFSKTTTS